MDAPGTAWLIWVLVTIAIPIGVIFIVLGVLRWSRLSAQKAVRSESYWEEDPDGRRYPTGYERMYDPEARRAATRGEYPEDSEPGSSEPEDGREDEGPGTRGEREGPSPGASGGADTDEGGSRPYRDDGEEPPETGR